MQRFEMPLECHDLALCGQIPQLGHAFFSASCQSAAIGSEGDTDHGRKCAGKLVCIKPDSAFHNVTLPLTWPMARSPLRERLALVIPSPDGSNSRIS